MCYNSNSVSPAGLDSLRNIAPCRRRSFIQAGGAAAITQVAERDTQNQMHLFILQT